MTDPITPPPALVQEWVVNTFHYNLKEKLIEAARWGSDQELEACVNWIKDQNNKGGMWKLSDLRAARRPKPPSLKQQALTELDSLENMGACNADTIRRALEALPE